MADEGASPRELLLESCRRNNTSLLHDVLASFSSTTNNASKLALFINAARDGLGAGALHVAAQYGSYEVLDVLLDQEGVEIDKIEPREGDTCLHRAVRFANTDRGRGLGVVEILLDAGCDPRIRNKGRLRPMDLADPGNKEVRTALQKAEFVLAAGNDVIRDDDDDHGGPASDSD